MFTDSRIKIFSVVVTEGSFTRAAKSLGISQPAVSQNIAELENEISDKLFIRRKKDNTLILTDKGKILFQYAKRLLHLYTSLNNELVPEYGYETEHLRISTTPILSKYFLPNILQEFKNSFPQIEVSLSTEDNSIIIEKVKDDEIDVGIINLKEVESIPPELKKIPFLNIYLTKTRSSLEEYYIVYKKDTQKNSIIETLCLAIESNE